MFESAKEACGSRKALSLDKQSYMSLMKKAACARTIEGERERKLIFGELVGLASPALGMTMTVDANLGHPRWSKKVGA